MPIAIQDLLWQYIQKLQLIYSEHLKTVILYGSFARGDFSETSDIDIMILLDLDEMEIKKFRHRLSETTFDFNLEHNIDIKPIAKSVIQFEKWQSAYPFYRNVREEGVTIYYAAT